MAFSFKSQLFPLTLLFLITFATAARILDEVTAPVPEAESPAADEASGAGSGIGSAGGASFPVGGASSGVSGTGGGATGGVGATGGGAAGGATATGGAAGAGGAAATGGAAGAGGVAHGEHPQLVFFMHDILGGTNPTAKAITGVVTNSAVSGQVPFAKPNGAILANQNNGPQNNGNSGTMNNNNVPFLTGLGGVNSNVMQNSGNNNFVGGNGFPVVNGAQLTSGTSLQQLMFGTMIAIDDEITEGHALNSGMVGRAQGFYVYSSVDGKTQTMAFTAMFQEGGYHNSLNFFGVHQTTVSESVLSVMGGTGKYVNAKGFAVVKTLPPVDQHESDGLQTVLELSVFLTY